MLQNSPFTLSHSHQNNLPALCLISLEIKVRTNLIRAKVLISGLIYYSIYNMQVNR